MEIRAHCPYCGERLSLWVDPGAGSAQHYIEDCTVCCQPIQVDATISGRRARVRLRRDDE